MGFADTTITEWFKTIGKDKKHSLLLTIANFSFLVERKDTELPVEIHDIPVLFKGRLDPDDLNCEFFEWEIAEGRVEELLKHCHFDPDTNPFVLSL